jgi:hypothetical protein
MPTPTNETETKRRGRKTLVPRKRILSDDCQRMQIALPGPLLTKLIDEAVEQGIPSLSEHMRHIVVAHLRRKERGESNISMNERLEASMKELRSRIYALHGGMEVLFAIQCRLLEATGNEEFVAEILEGGIDREKFNSLIRPKGVTRTVGT